MFTVFSASYELILLFFNSNKVKIVKNTLVIFRYILSPSYYLLYNVKMKTKETKICKICRVSKDVAEFWKHNGTKDKLFPSCKDCNSIIKKGYYAENRSKFIDYGKKYYRRVTIKDSIGHICYNTLYQHKRKGYKVDITIEELINMANAAEYCSLCNEKLDKTLGNKVKCQKNSLSFDCINHEKEFIRGNIRAICNYCNIKGKRTKRKNKNRRSVDLYFRKINTLASALLSQKETLNDQQITTLENLLKNS